MTEIIVTNCGDCPFGKPWYANYCRHPNKSELIEKMTGLIPNNCPLIKEDTVIKINVNE